MSSPSNALSQAQLVAAAKASPTEANRTPWLYQTSDFINFDKYGAVALPAIGTQATVLSFTVPNGRNGRITALGIDFTANGGAAFTQNVLPAQLTFSIQADQTASIFADYGAFNYLPGAVSLPVSIAGLMIKEGQIITVMVINNTIVATTQFLGARLLGYYYPKKREPSDSGYQ
jgi:hypothetical protein